MVLETHDFKPVGSSQCKETEIIFLLYFYDCRQIAPACPEPEDISQDYSRVLILALSMHINN
jgi:hypothetical protein